MSTLAPASRTRKPARSAHGTCGLTLTINGTAYRMRPLGSDTAFGTIRAFRLTKQDGITYDVAQTIEGNTCDCPDHVFHRDGLDPAGCKHLKALRACGVLD